MTPVPIGELLRTYRNRTGMTQDDLAAASGVTGGLIGNVERGTRNLGPEVVHAVADALDLSPEERDALVAARRRYAEMNSSKGAGGRPPPWEELLEGQRRLSEQLDRLASLIEQASG